MDNKYYTNGRNKKTMLNKKLLLCFTISLLFFMISGCVYMNRVFAFDSTEIEKITINDFEITDVETIAEIAAMFAKISGNKIDGTTNERTYQYDFQCYDAENHIVQYFLCDDNGTLFKPGNYNDPYIFRLNYYYSGHLNYEDLQRILEIIG